MACPNAAPCLVPPYTRRCTESTSMNASVSAPGSNGVRAASSASTRRCTAASWRTLPWSNARRKLPSVDGARIPPTVAGNAPWRSRSIPSMVSAPATIPATSEPIFNTRVRADLGGHPHMPAGQVFQPDSSGPAAPPVPARRATPDSDHQTWRVSWPRCATIASQRCPFDPGVCELQATRILPGQRALLLSRHTPENNSGRWIQAQAAIGLLSSGDHRPIARKSGADGTSRRTNRG